jgi:cardiolipin synthase
MGTPAAHPAWIRPVPNALTFLRLALAVALPFLPIHLWLPTIALAAATDGLDGWIARRFHATSDLGRLLDGVADKAFAFSAVLTLVTAGRTPWWHGALVLSRDFVVAALAARLAVTRRWEGFRDMQVRAAGKFATLAAFAWFLTLLFPTPESLSDSAFVVAAGASLWAAGDYLLQAARLRRRLRTGRGG